jgi:Tfp pilus assembly protein PilF
MDNKFPDNDRYYIKAMDDHDAGDIALSAELFGEMIEKFPEDSRAWQGLAEIYFLKIGDIVKAEEYFIKAIESGNASARTYLLYSDLLLQLNRFAEMNAMVNKAMAIPGVSQSAGFFKSGLLKESQGNYDESIELYRKTILSSFLSDEIDLAEKAMLRCQIKKKYA